MGLPADPDNYNTSFLSSSRATIRMRLWRMVLSTWHNQESTGQRVSMRHSRVIIMLIKARSSTHSKWFHSLGRKPWLCKSRESELSTGGHASISLCSRLWIGCDLLYRAPDTVTSVK